MTQTQNEEMNHPQEPGSEEQTLSQDMKQEEGIFTVSFDAVYADIFDGLDATDTADGTNRRTRKMYIIISLLMCIQIVWFAFSKSGIALLFAIFLGAVALMLKSKSQRFNKEIAKEFEKEGHQTVLLKEDGLMLNEKQVAYTEVAKLYDLKRCFSLIYQGNHVFIIPKKTMDQEQLQTFTSLMKDKVGDAYVDTVSK